MIDPIDFPELMQKLSIAVVEGVNTARPKSRESRDPGCTREQPGSQARTAMGTGVWGCRPYLPNPISQDAESSIPVP